MAEQEPKKRPGKDDFKWRNMQAFQTRGVQATQLVEHLDKKFGAENYNLERQDGTTWLLRSHKKLTTTDLNNFVSPTFWAENQEPPSAAPNNDDEGNNEG